MITLQVNNRPIEAQPGEMLLTALRRAGINVPTLCNLEQLTPTGACRLCVVEVEGQRNLMPSCAFPVAPGMKVWTHSPRALRARKTIVELLLANHPDDCLYCVRNNNCRLQQLAAELGVRQRRYFGARRQYHADTSSASIVRDPAKCILCGKCVRVCEEIQGVAAIDFIHRGSRAHVGTAFDQGLNVSSCINCGQCVMVCPTGALTEQSHIKEVVEALNHRLRAAAPRDGATANGGPLVVVQHAPAVSVTIAEELGLRPGADAAGILNAMLRRLGFDRVFDTSFSADLTVMEEAAELVHRIKTGGPLPLLTSCSPGWIKYVEEFHPDFVGNLSTCKSPQQMLGALIKSHLAECEGRDAADIYSVAIMPCTAKKFEAGRPELARHGLPDVDAVLTTRELLRLIRLRGLDPARLDPEPADSPFGERSSAGKLFGATGGVAEAALRTAHYLLTGQELPVARLKAVRGLDAVKQVTVKMGELEVHVAVVSGLANAGRLLDEIRTDRRHLHFVEVMTCPGGCIAGGGQPLGTDRAALRSRLDALYRIDRDAPLRAAHRNPTVRRLYEEFLGEPLSTRSHELLHTQYHAREVVH
ncbi:MAG: [FeFe] hydrogenase, group A [Planctomycetota bacterium]